jgi:RNase P/RNase MRP subunit p30
MKRHYTDLHLCPSTQDAKQTQEMIDKAAKLGYRLTAITFHSNCTEQEIQQIKSICAEANIDLATRVDLKPNTPGELIRSLRKLRRKFEIVAVICDTKNVSRQAAKDRRVDLLNFPCTDFHRRFFDMAEAELASSALASLEIEIKPLLTTEGAARIRLLSSLRKEAATAKDFHVPIVISSGATNELLMRKPIEFAALASLFDLDKKSALDAVSKNPQTIVRTNREKLSPKFIAPGIRLVKKGKDC